MAGEHPTSTFRRLTPEERDRIVSEGERIYRERVSEAEKRQHHGGYVAIDAVDGRFEFGKTLGEADDRLSPLPEGHFVFIQRIGLPFRIHRSPRL